MAGAISDQFLGLGLLLSFKEKQTKNLLYVSFYRSFPLFIKSLEIGNEQHLNYFHTCNTVLLAFSLNKGKTLRLHLVYFAIKIACDNRILDYLKIAICYRIVCNNCLL